MNDARERGSERTDLSEPGRRPNPATVRTAGWIAVAAALAFVLTGGGRIVGSDEVTMLEVSRSLLAGHVTVPAGATSERPDGQHVSKNAAGQAIAALPLVALAEGAVRLGGVARERRALALRFGASFFNAIVTALLLAVFYVVVRRMGAGAGGALATTFMLGFTTPLWVYAKSYMAEPLQALGLILAVAGASRAAAATHADPKAERVAALGVFVAVSAKLSMLPLAAAALVPLLGAPFKRWRVPLAGLAAALVGHALYNAARFGTPLETGYGVQATPSAYTTPLWVGLYGLLLSSGKGVLWFAPGLWLAPAGWRAMRVVAPARARSTLARLGFGTLLGGAAWGVLVAWVAGFLLYGTFQHWAGDGSFGPRYLLPLLPLGFVPVAFALSPPGGRAIGRARRRWAMFLALAGLLVQIGGVSIYFGAQMREAGDYPYTLPLDHPRSMSDSHFNPAFSPIVGHWRMLIRNVQVHLRGAAPTLRVAGGEGRLGLEADEQRSLLRALDLWWLYLGYAGLPRAPVYAAVLVLKLIALFALWRLARAWRRERAIA